MHSDYYYLKVERTSKELRIFNKYYANLKTDIYKFWMKDYYKAKIFALYASNKML